MSRDRAAIGRLWNRVISMAASNFRNSLALVLAHEGGYVNHPKDPGGATNRGITQAVYDAFRRYHGLKPQSVRNIADSEVSEIYNKNYWRLVRGDSLPCGVDYAVFDFAVNSGVSRAVRYLQRLVGVKDDGVLGVISLAAIEEAAKRNEEQLIAQYCANRMAFLRSLSTFPTFGKGWTRRVIGYSPGVQDKDTGVIDYATHMARHDSQYLMPSPIGSVAGEEPTPAKAIALEHVESFPEAPTVISLQDAKAKLAELNDALAMQIG